MTDVQSLEFHLGRLASRVVCMNRRLGTHFYQQDPLPHATPEPVVLGPPGVEGWEQPQP